ncbi:hypothetical protein JCM8547_003556 [Rhodosporidiobolus lusitaniae]
MATKDYLSSLPPGLLTEIFKLAYEGDSTTTGALSRTLLHYHRAEKFKRVTVKTPSQVKKLAKRLRKRSERYLGRIHYRRQRLHLKTVASFALKYASSTLSTLHLVFDLNEMRLDFSAHTDDEDYFSFPLQPLSRVSDLTIIHPFFEKFPVAPIVKACSALRTLTFRGTDEECDFWDNLEDARFAITPTFTSLFLETPASGYYGFCAPVDEVVADYSNLERLHLGNNTFHFGFLLHNLSKLPSLSFLSLGPGAKFLAEGFSTSSLPSLKRLVINSVETGKRGWSMKQHGRLHKQPMRDVLTSDGVVLLVKECQKRGISVGGTAVEGARVFQDWLDEVDECLALYSAEIRFSQAVNDEITGKIGQLFGPEYLEAWVIEHEMEWEGHEESDSSEGYDSE